MKHVLPNQRQSVFKKFAPLLPALVVTLVLGLVGCDLWYKDMKGYLEYWTATLGVSNPQVSQGYQMDSSGRMTISTREAVTATVENPDGHAVNGGVGPSSDILKSVRISGAAGDAALSSGPRVTVGPTSLTLELPPLSPVPTGEPHPAEHKDFTVLLAPVRTETNMSPSNPLSLTFRYNTPPRMPLAVIKESNGNFRWPRQGDRWEVSSGGEICWAWPKNKTRDGGGSTTDPDYVEWFYIEDGVTDRLEAEATLLQPNSHTLPKKDGIEYNVYAATGLAQGAPVKVYAEDGERVRGQAAVSGPIHRITLHGNGGSFGASAAPSATMYVGEGSIIKVGDLETPSYPGLSLSGWFEQSVGGQSFSFPHRVSGALTLHAQWRGNTYTVTFNDDSGAGGPGSLTAAYNQTPPPLPSRPARAGYTFGGYFTEKNGGGTEYYDGSGAPQGIWKEPQPTTLYAKWTANIYTITFEKDGASGGSDDTSVTYGQLPLTIVPPSPKAGGFIFAGYNTKPDGTGTKYYDASGTGVGTWQEPKDTTLYAQWNYEAPQKDSSGSYQISNPGNLLWIAQQIKTVVPFNLKLTADIVIPSGTWKPIHHPDGPSSTFDGQGYSITLDEKGGGLFEYIGYSTIKNLVLKGEIRVNTNGNAGVVTGSAFDTTIENVMSEVTITNLGTGETGGLVGVFGGNNPAKAFIKNCAVYADVTGAGETGGLVGRFWSKNCPGTISNSVYMGAVSGSPGGAIVGSRNSDYGSTLSNIYYCETGGLSPIGDDSSGLSTVDSKTKAEIASDATANLLNTGLQTPQWEYKQGANYPTLKQPNP